jgi:hypothetical protein
MDGSLPKCLPKLPSNTAEKATNVAGATSRPLIFCLLPAPHRTYITAPRPRHLSPTPQVSCLCRVTSCWCHVSVMSVPCHTCSWPCPTPVLSSSATPLPRKVPCVSGHFCNLPALSLCFSAHASHGLFLDRSPV